MHTARQLNRDLFQITLADEEAAREELLEEWGPLHRFGVVVNEPFGTVGASYLLQLAITAFYDSRPERRSRERPVYPDVFAFHVGGRFGDHGFYDVYPPRKEVFVENEPAAILDAINDRGITHLAVPDREVDAVQHGWKEPAQALDRIVAAWAYSPTGRTAGGDVAITCSSPLADANSKIALGSEQTYAERQQARAFIGDIQVPPEEFLGVPEDREGEVSPAARKQIWEERSKLAGPDGRTETYRRIPVRDALGMLHEGAAPAFREQPSMEEVEAGFEAGVTGV